MSMECKQQALVWHRGKLLGKGAYGCVFYGLSSEGQSLAVKTTRLKTSVTLQKEKRILEQFRDCSDQIVSCFGNSLTIGKDGSPFYDLFLEYAQGGSLSHFIKTTWGGRIPEEDARKYIRMILTALSVIHKKGYVHCDLKPDNILVFASEDDGVKLKLADFGLSREPGEVPEEEDEWKWQFRGTPLYMSPESVADGRIDASLGIWSLGCVVIKMVTGQGAWKMNTDALYHKLCFEKEAPEIPDCMSAKGKDFLRKCFELNPDKRWTASQLLTHPFVREQIKRVHKNAKPSA